VPPKKKKKKKKSFPSERVEKKNGVKGPAALAGKMELDGKGIILVSGREVQVGRSSTVNFYGTIECWLMILG